MNRLARQQKTQLNKTARRFNLRLLYIFGSCGRGDTRADSDLDIAFQSARSLAPREFNDLRLALNNIFTDSRRAVDLVDINSATPLLRSMVAREGRLIYGSRLNDAVFYGHALQQYLDAKPLFELSKQYAHSRLAV